MTDAAKVFKRTATLKAALSPYRVRCIQQAEQWINGEARHNAIDNECTPDFSCCYPQLFEHDRAKRVAYLRDKLARWGLPDRLDD